jgi:hypothetical protein
VKGDFPLKFGGMELEECEVRVPHTFGETEGVELAPSRSAAKIVELEL